VRELPPVNYLIQKSKRSCPFITHVDKLKPWYTDNPPKSWLTANDDNIGLDVILGVDDKGTAGQSPDFENLDDANPVTDTTTIDGPDNGDRQRQPHDDARVVPIPEVDSDSKIDIRQNDDDKTAGVEWSGGDAGVETSGLINSDGTVRSGKGDDAGVGAMVLVNSDSGADAGWSDDVAGIGLEDSISSGNLVAVGQLEGGIGTGEVRALDNDKGSVSAGPLKLGNLGVGDGSRSYTCDPNDGDGLRSYTGNPNDGVGSRSYTCDPDDGVRPGHCISGRCDNSRPSDEVSGHNDEYDDECDDERDMQRFPTTMRRQADPESTTGQADRLQDGRPDVIATSTRSSKTDCQTAPSNQKLSPALTDTHC